MLYSIRMPMIGSTKRLTRIGEWVRYKDKPEVRGFYKTKQSQEVYRPVGLKETDLGLQYGNKENIVNNFKKDMDELIGSVVKDYRVAAEKRCIYIYSGQPWELMFLRKKYSGALSDFNKALGIFNKKGRGNSTGALKVMPNISKVHYALKKYDKAGNYYDIKINPAKVDRYAYPGKVSAGETHGAAVETNEKDILFLDAEE